MNTNSANSIAGSASAAGRALAASLPGAKQELADGAIRAREQLSAGMDDARDYLDEGRTRLAEALDSAVAATRAGLRNYRSQAEQQFDTGVERARGLRETIAARGRNGLAYSAELGAQAAERLQGIGARLMKSAARHPYVAVGVVAGACYLIVRRLTRGPAAAAKAAGVKRRSRRARAEKSRSRAKETRAANGSASA
jgi:hypothetical protein